MIKTWGDAAPLRNMIMSQRSQGRRQEINQTIKRHLPTSSKKKTDYLNFISAIQSKSTLLNHDSCRFIQGCDSIDDVIKRLIVVFKLRQHAIRRIFDWQPDRTQSSHLQYCDLVRHLFTRYRVPKWLLNSNSTFDLLALIRIGVGGSLRTAWPDIKFSKLMVRALWQVPPAMQRTEAFAWAYTKTLGGSDELAKVLCSCDCLFFLNEELRTVVIRFFVRCERDETTPLLQSEIPDSIKFIRAIKLLPARVLLRQRVHFNVGPLIPDFSLEGRNLRWLRRKMANWQQEQLAELNPKSSSNTHAWLPSDVGGLELIQRNFQWKIFELCSSWRLQYEGRKMHHCVASYGKKCSSGKAAIWTVRRTDMRTNSTRSMATIEVDPNAQTIVQVKSKYNSPPSIATMKIISQWADSASLRIAEAI